MTTSEYLVGLKKQSDYEEKVSQCLVKERENANAELMLGLYTQKKSLTSYELKTISEDPTFFQKITLTDFSRTDFDEYSKSLSKIIVNPEQLDYCADNLKIIFNTLFSAAQLHRHFNLFLYYINLAQLSDDQKQKHISNHLTLISLDKLKEAAAQSQGMNLVKFNEDFLICLEASSHTQKVVEEEKKQMGNSLKEVLGEELRNTTVAEEILDNEIPGDIWNAQGVYTTTILKYQVAALTAQGLLPDLLRPLGVIAMAVPPLLGIGRKLYLRNVAKSPIAVNPLTNFNRTMTHEKSSTFIGRQDIIDRIFAVWAKKQHPVLVGDPGSGKSTIMAEVARRIAMKEIKGFEEITVFVGSAAALVFAGGFGPPPFGRVIRTLTKYRENVVLMLDEAHSLASDKNILNLVRSATDDSNDSLRYCLFGTTTNEFPLLVSDPSLQEFRKSK